MLHYNLDVIEPYWLGGLYYRGQGVRQSYEAALELYVRSAKQGNAHADYELAKMYRDGFGTQKNTEEADRHLKVLMSAFLHWRKKVTMISCNTVSDK